MAFESTEKTPEPGKSNSLPEDDQSQSEAARRRARQHIDTNKAYDVALQKFA
jgi:hypothetical protein